MPEDFAELMLSFSLFQGYTVWGTKSLIERGKIEKYATGHVLFTQGAPATTVVLVLTGEVEQFVAASGREFCLSGAGPSHVLADVQVLAETNHPASARTVGETTVLAWEGPAFRRLVAADSTFALRVFHQTAMSLAEQAETLSASLAAFKQAI